MRGAREEEQGERRSGELLPRTPKGRGAEGRGARARGARERGARGREARQREVAIETERRVSFHFL